MKNNSNLWMKLFFGLLVLILAGSIGVGLYAYRFLYRAASVNGKIFTRLQVIQSLEKKFGKEYVAQQVSKELILEEAAKTNTTVTDAEIDADISAFEENMKQQGKTLEDALKERGLTKDELREQVKIQKLVVKMIAKDITVTNDEINEQIAKLNPPKGAKKEELQGMFNQIKQNLQRQKLDERYASWTKELEQKAKITYDHTY